MRSTSVPVHVLFVPLLMVGACLLVASTILGQTNRGAVNP